MARPRRRATTNGVVRPWTEADALRNTRARFEQWAKNPLCQANAMSAVHNLRMDVVAKKEGIETSFGASPFALARGETFERDLLRNQAASLRDALVERDVLPESEHKFEDLRLAMNGGRIKTLEQAVDRTRELIMEVARSTPRRRRSLPAIIAAPTVKIPRKVMMPEAILIIDTLVIRLDLERPRLIVGEVKTYPDRGGHTDPHELALARAQAGLYVHAMDLLVGELGVEDEIEVSRRGFLVLTRPGSNQPAVRAEEDLRYQALRAQRGMDLLEVAAVALPPVDGEPPTQDDVIRAILGSKTAYSEACLGFCDRAPKCFGEAYEAGDPVVLGTDAIRFLGATDLHRVDALLDGSKPKNDAEKDLLRRIRESRAIAG